MRPLPLLLVASLALGCGGGASDPFADDLKMICGAGQGARAAEHEPRMRQLMAMREIADKIKTPEAARLMASVVQVAPADRAALMHDALAKAGIKRCALLDVMQ